MRIAIINDSPMAVEVMRRTISASESHEVAWLARDGAQGIEACARDTPDLILMDLVMPGIDGVEATRQIMAQSPCGILIVTATVAGHTGKIFQALGAGALDVVATPAFGGDGTAHGEGALLAKIATLGRLIGNGSSRARDAASVASPRRGSHNSLVAIGASAGGPAAIAMVLANLPADFPGAIVIVQHVDEEFAPLMATWLNEQSRIPVRIAVEGDQPQPGLALMAATNDHLIFVGPQTLGYTHEPAAHSYRPSVDVFFHSVVRHWKGDVVGVLLTGMGRDGAGGLKALREVKALTIAQDGQSSVVYGMPKAAAQIGAAEEILPLHAIASRLQTYFPSARSGVQ